MKLVSAEEYEVFVKTNKNIAYCNISGISEPPAINHYDKNGKLLAHTFDYDAGYIETPEEEREYYIRDEEEICD